MTPFRTTILATTLLLGTATMPASAQHAGQDMTMPMPMPAAGSAGASPAGSMMASMDKMSKDMAAVPMTGDADRDFTAMMIPHHQGAVDMARWQLAHGKDPALRRFSKQVIAAQTREIAFMRQWLAKHPAP